VPCRDSDGECAVFQASGRVRNSLAHTADRFNQNLAGGMPAQK
jgi:hypothetical protein